MSLKPQICCYTIGLYYKNPEYYADLNLFKKLQKIQHTLLQTFFIIEIYFTFSLLNFSGNFLQLLGCVLNQITKISAFSDTLDE
jgi:hypothetical protein